MQITSQFGLNIDVPATWKLRVQLVFGSVEAPAGEKAFISDEDRFKTFN